MGDGVANPYFDVVGTIALVDGVDMVGLRSAVLTVLFLELMNFGMNQDDDQMTMESFDGENQQMEYDVIITPHPDFCIRD